MDLKDRMEGYDRVFQRELPARCPAILRIDGRAFHTLLRNADKPFDERFATVMNTVAYGLMGEISTARFAYTQSDEISFLLIDYNRFESQQWFGGNIQKMTSVSASLASAWFTSNWCKDGGIGAFDSRVFTIPERDIKNYFIWRQRDWERNSIQMLARKYYSHKELLGKTTNEQQEMIFQKGENWNDLPVMWKRGRVINRNTINVEIPEFSKNDTYIESFMEIEEE